MAPAPTCRGNSRPRACARVSLCAALHLHPPLLSLRRFVGLARSLPWSDGLPAALALAHPLPSVTSRGAGRSTACPLPELASPLPRPGSVPLPPARWHELAVGLRWRRRFVQAYVQRRLRGDQHSQRLEGLRRCAGTRANVWAGTRARLRRDARTSAPGHAHVCAGAHASARAAVSTRRARGRTRVREGAAHI